MATFAAVMRIPFAGIMSFQPTTFIVMITGYVYGIQTGFFVGSIAALVSNMFLGQGPWTPWQMFCWGLCGLLSGLYGRNKDVFKAKHFIILCGVCAYVYGNIMTLWHWVTFVYPLNLTTFLETYLLSLPFDTLHCIGNVLFASLFGETFYMILKRFKSKIGYEILMTDENV